MKSSSPLFLLLLSLASTLICASELILLNTKNARTFASSVEEGSASHFATDEEVYYDQPTCFRSSPNTFDEDMFNWLVVDLGSVIHNLTEVYIASGQNHDSDSVEVFVTTYLRTSAHISKSGSTLIWDSYQECGQTSSDEHSGSSATVRCTHPLDGRWLILRRKSPKSLSICLLAVYVTKTEDTCFRTVDPRISSSARGNEFRYERHISLEQCRESCIDTLSCRGLAFTKESRRGRSGDCRLFRGPDSEISREDVDTDQEDRTLPINCGKWCHLEQNECNRGEAFPLVRQTEHVPYSTPGTTIWKLEDSKLKSMNSQLQKIFFALRFKGRILCEAESCGVIHIFLISEEGEETFCTSINTDLISTLDRYTIQCREDSPTTNLGSDTVAIKMIPSTVDQSAPKLEIISGIARFILIDKRRQINSVSEIPIRPEEFFVLPLLNPGRESVSIPKEVEIPVTLSESLVNVKQTEYRSEPKVVKEDPNGNGILENQSVTSFENLLQTKPILSEPVTILPTEPAKILQDIVLSSKLDDNSIKNNEDNVVSEADHHLDLYENLEDEDKTFDSEDEAENLHPEPSMTTISTNGPSKQEPDLNFAIKKPSLSSEDWTRHEDPYVTELEGPKHNNEARDYETAEKKFDSNVDPVMNVEQYFPSETLSNPILSSYPPITPNSMQRDAEDSNQEVEQPISRQRKNITVTSETNHLSPSGVQVAGSLSKVNLFMIITITSVVILALVAGIVWFVCIRGN
nr:hypothetical protein HmN_000006400 [Hymenolepis microstoma]